MGVSLMNCDYKECKKQGHCFGEIYSNMIDDLCEEIKLMENITEDEIVKLNMDLASKIAQDISKRFKYGVTKGS